jgi:hypothetical protein
MILEKGVCCADGIYSLCNYYAGLFLHRYLCHFIFNHPTPLTYSITLQPEILLLGFHTLRPLLAPHLSSRRRLVDFVEGHESARYRSRTCRTFVPSAYHLHILRFLRGLHVSILSIPAIKTL